MTIKVTKELIAECAMMKWATGDYKCVWKMFDEKEHTEEEVKAFLDKHGEQIDTIEDTLVDIIAKEIKL